VIPPVPGIEKGRPRQDVPAGAGRHETYLLRSFLHTGQELMVNFAKATPDGA